MNLHAYISKTVSRMPNTKKVTGWGYNVGPSTIRRNVPIPSRHKGKAGARAGARKCADKTVNDGKWSLVEKISQYCSERIHDWSHQFTCCVQILRKSLSCSDWLWHTTDRLAWLSTRDTCGDAWPLLLACITALLVVYGKQLAVKPASAYIGSSRKLAWCQRVQWGGLYCTRALKDSWIRE